VRHAAEADHVEGVDGAVPVPALDDVEGVEEQRVPRVDEKVPTEPRAARDVKPLLPQVPVHGKKEVFPRRNGVRRRRIGALSQLHKSQRVQRVEPGTKKEGKKEEVCVCFFGDC
jgi:hypothetical protein